MSETTEHPLHEVIGHIHNRISRLGQVKSFDGELSKREFRDELYPALGDITAFLGDIDDRLTAIEEGDEGMGIPPELADAIVEGFTRFGVCLDLLGKHIPAGEDRTALDEHRTWFQANAAGILSDVREAVEGESEPSESEDVASAP